MKYKLNLVFDPDLLKDEKDGSKHYCGSLFSEATDAPTWGILLPMLRMALIEAEATMQGQRPIFNKLREENPDERGTQA